MIPCIDRVDSVLHDDHDWVYQGRPETLPVQHATDVLRFRYCRRCDLDEVLERAGEVRS